MQRNSWYAVAAAVLVALSSLPLGLFIDDYMMVLGVERKIPFGSPWDLFAFADGNPEATLLRMNLGPMPWFTSPNIVVHFFRPLTCATMMLDHALFGRHFAVYHLHSVFWYAAFVAAVALLYRRRFSPGLAVLALFLFAVDEAHWLPAAWWSNRNALVSATCALWGFLAYLRWREARWFPGLPLSLLGFALGLLGGETALGIVAYLAAYELFGPNSLLKTPFADGRNRFAALVPLGLLGVAYLLFYKWAGYGARDSSIYVDPTASPAEFLSLLPGRMAMLIAQHFFGMPGEVSVFTPSLRVPMIAAGLLLTALAVAAIRYAWPLLDENDRKSLRWLLAGSILSMLPVCATFPAGRLLLAPSIGGAAAIALLIRAGWKKADAPPSMRLLATLFVGMHLVLAPLLWPVQTIFIRTLSAKFEKAVSSMAIAPAADRDREVVMIASGDPMIGFYAPLILAFQGKSLPDSARTLSMAPYDLRVTRTRPNTLEVEVLNGQLLTSLFEQLLRGKNDPVKPGDVVQLEGMRVTVNETGDKGPTRFTVDWDHDIETPRTAFLAWDGTGLNRVALPAVGGTLEIPHKKAVLH